jgi:hypothetical protein
MKPEGRGGARAKRRMCAQPRTRCLAHSAGRGPLGSGPDSKSAARPRPERVSADSAAGRPPRSPLLQEQACRRSDTPADRAIGRGPMGVDPCVLLAFAGIITALVRLSGGARKTRDARGGRSRLKRLAVLAALVAVAGGLRLAVWEDHMAAGAALPPPILTPRSRGTSGLGGPDGSWCHVHAFRAVPSTKCSTAMCDNVCSSCSGRAGLDMAAWERAPEDGHSCSFACSCMLAVGLLRRFASAAMMAVRSGRRHCKSLMGVTRRHLAPRTILVFSSFRELWPSYKIRAVLILIMLIHCRSVSAQSFTTKAIGQSNPVAGASNTITVTLVSDTALAAADGSAVTVSGLTGVVASSPVTLVDAGDDGETIFSDGTTQGRGAWSSGTLTLTVHSGGSVVASTTYTFKFVITNPASANTSPTINIQASGTATIASAAMTKPGTALYGVANGADPLTVQVPSFSVKSIQQSTPMSGATNTLTVSLTANFNLATGSKVTISGLTGSQTADSGSLTVSSTSNLLGTSGAWTQASGQLVLTAASGGTASGTVCVVTFVLYNPAAAQASPAVSVLAAIEDGSSGSVGSIASAAMTKPGTALYGVANGADTLRVVAPVVTAVSPGNFLSSEGARVILYGSSFGTSNPLAVQLSAGVGNSVCEQTSWTSDSSLACTVMAATQGTRSVTVTLFMKQAIRTLLSVLSFDLHSMSSSSQSNLATSASSSPLFIAGLDMGHAGMSQQMRASATSAASTLWLSTSSVTSKVGATCEDVCGFFVSMPVYFFFSIYHEMFLFSNMTVQSEFPKHLIFLHFLANQVRTPGLQAGLQDSRAFAVIPDHFDGVIRVFGINCIAEICDKVIMCRRQFVVFVNYGSIQILPAISGQEKYWQVCEGSFILRRSSFSILNHQCCINLQHILKQPNSNYSSLTEVQIDSRLNGDVLVEDNMSMGPDTDIAVIQAMLFFAIMCALFYAFDSLNDHLSSTKRIKLRRNGKLIVLLGLASIIAVGAQSFTTKAIGQSNPVAGASNTITVTLVSDTALAAADGSAVTVSGLTGVVASSPVTLVDAGDDGETIFSDGTTQGRGAWSSGTLTLTVHSGGSVVASTTYTFKFVITNPASANTSPTINIQASGTATIASAAMTKPGTALYGVANGADPLTVQVPSFSVKSIQQSTPMSGATNTLTVSLTANFNLATGSKVTISGLTGSQTADSGSLTVSSTSNLLGTSGAWTQASGQLVLTAASGGTASGTVCVVTFVLYNPAAAQASPAVSVLAAIEDGSSGSVGSIASAAMTKPGTALYGVANGADPLTVQVPSFSVKSIQQSDIMAGVPNSLTVSLTANFNLATGSKVTISGLTGSQTADSGSLTVSSTSNLLGTSGAWTQASGQLVLTAASGGTASGTVCVVTFVLYNPAAAQASPAVSVLAAIEDGSSGSVGSIASAAMTKPGTALYGVANGADPLSVIIHAISVSTSANAGVDTSSSLTITGTSTGLFSKSGKARFHYTACETTFWVSDSHTVCKVPSGMFSTLKAIVTVGENAVPASANEAVSYDRVGMKLISPPGCSLPFASCYQIKTCT